MTKAGPELQQTLDLLRQQLAAAEQVDPQLADQLASVISEIQNTLAQKK